MIADVEVNLMAVLRCFRFDFAAPIRAHAVSGLSDRGDLIGNDLCPFVPHLEPSLDDNRVIQNKSFHTSAVDIGPDDHLDKAASVLQLKASIAVAFFSIPQSERRDNPPHLYFPIRRFFPQLDNGAAGQFMDDLFVFI